MKSFCLAAFLASVCCRLCAADVGSDEPANYPHRVLRNDTGMRVMVMLVDGEKGFYRGTRFDWSGHIAQARYRGHTFFGVWRRPHDPTNYEHGVGPCDEFGITDPPGYAKAKPGEPFLKIGVGLLERVDEKPYHFSNKYPLVDVGRWSQGRGEFVASSQHELRSDVDWGYRYSKSIEVPSDRPEFIIRRTLKNIEGNDIKTASYNHNFIRIDDEPIGPSYELELSEPLEAEVGAPAKFDGRRLTFTDKVEKPLMIYFKGQPKRTKRPGGRSGNPSFDVAITNFRTGGRMEIKHAFEVSELRLWVTTTAICPEPFLKIDLGPAESISWATTYRLSTLEEAKEVAK